MFEQVEIRSDDGEPNHGTKVDGAYTSLKDAVGHESDIEKTQDGPGEPQKTVDQVLVLAKASPWRHGRGEGAYQK